MKNEYVKDYTFFEKTFDKHFAPFMYLETDDEIFWGILYDDLIDDYILFLEEHNFNDMESLTETFFLSIDQKSTIQKLKENLG